MKPTIELNKEQFMDRIEHELDFNEAAMNMVDKLWDDMEGKSVSLTSREGIDAYYPAFIEDFLQIVDDSMDLGEVVDLVKEYSNYDEVINNNPKLSKVEITEDSLFAFRSTEDAEQEIWSIAELREWWANYVEEYYMGLDNGSYSAKKDADNVRKMSPEELLQDLREAGCFIDNNPGEWVALTAEEAKKLNNGAFELGDQQKTFYAWNGNYIENDFGFGPERNASIFSFESKKERDEAVAKYNKIRITHIPDDQELSVEEINAYLKENHGYLEQYDNYTCEIAFANSIKEDCYSECYDFNIVEINTKEKLFKALKMINKEFDIDKYVFDCLGAAFNEKHAEEHLKDAKFIKNNFLECIDNFDQKFDKCMHEFHAKDKQNPKEVAKEAKAVAKAGNIKTYKNAEVER